ncbi:MAG: spore germination protein [Bacilli bacterium]|nr:spore germination protein [Bacilli bacterium]
MQKINKNIDKVIKEIKKIYGNSSDIITRTINIKGNKVGFLFLESTSQTDAISDYIIKSAIYTEKSKNIFNNLFNILKNKLFNSQLLVTNDFEKFPYYLSSGFTILIVEGNDKAIVMETKANLDRGITESSSEPIIRGSKDSFTESHAKNLGLIRKRIKDPNLWFEEIKIGRRTKTKTTIAYINGIADNKKIMQIKKRLTKIDIDGILDSGNIRDYLTVQKSIFPQIKSSERPDMVCQELLNGKIIILVENSPFTLILPTVFLDFIRSPEDQNEKAINITFTRILRFFALIITILTPALYIAVATYDQNTIPDKLLISLAVQREGVPFPTFFEIILFMTIFEILRESDLKSPTNMSSAMSIVGALVLGQAAVDAALVSPITIIIVAITSICSLIFQDSDFINGIRFWRFLFITASSMLGAIGILSMTLIWITKMASLENLNTSFLAPLAPFNKNDNKDAIIKATIPNIYKRPKYLNVQNIIKQGGKK